MKLKNKRGQVWISAVLYFLIAAVIITVMLEAGMPLLNEMRDKSTFSHTKDSMLEINQIIKEVSKEGQGSKRVVPIQIKKGELSIDDEKLQWTMDSEAKILESRSELELGDLKIYADTDVNSFLEGDYYILSNSFITANLTKYGSSTNHVPIDTSNLLNSLYNVQTGETTSGTFNFTHSRITSNPVGYSSINAIGTNLGVVTVTYYLYNSTSSTDEEHQIKISLLSQTDFLKVDLN